jgi:hypothetical protein
MGAAQRTGLGRAQAPLPAVAALACAALTGCGSPVAAKDAPVTVDATGCQQVTGLGPVRWIARSPAFWSVLATAAGIPADQATFPHDETPAAIAPGICQMRFRGDAGTEATPQTT